MKAKFRDKLNTLPPHLKNVPKLEQWLQVVGLCPNSIQVIDLFRRIRLTSCHFLICFLLQNICSKVKTVEALLEKPQCKLRNLLCNCSQLDEEFRRLSTALKNLKRYTGNYRNAFLSIDRIFLMTNVLCRNFIRK